MESTANMNRDNIVFLLAPQTICLIFPSVLARGLQKEDDLVKPLQYLPDRLYGGGALIHITLSLVS